MRIAWNAKRKRLVGRGLAAVAALFVLFVMFGFFVAPSLIRRAAVSRLSALLDRPVALREVSVNPLTLTVTLRGLSIAARGGGPFVDLDEARARVSLASIRHLAPVVDELTLDRPRLHFARRADGELDVADLVAKFSRPAAPGEKPARFSVANIVLQGGEIDFVDEPVGRTHTVRRLRLQVPFVSNLPRDIEVFVEPLLEAEINGRALSLRGKTRPFAEDRETAVDFAIRDIDVPFYMQYAPKDLGFRLPSGRLDVEARVSFRQPKDAPAAVVVSGALDGRDFNLADAGGTVLVKLPRTRLEVAGFDWAARTLKIAALRFFGPAVDLAFDERGRFNLAALGGSPPPDAAPRPAAPAARASAPFVVDVDLVRVEGGTLTFADAPRRFATAFHDVVFEATGFSTRPGAAAKATLSGTSDQNETLQATADWGIAPWFADVRAKAGAAALARYAPYYRDMVLFDVREGQADLDAEAHFASAAKGGAATLTLGGEARGLALRKRGEEQDFLAAPRATFSGAKTDFNARSFELGEAAVEAPRLGVRWPKDGPINVVDLVPASPAGAPQWSWIVKKAAGSGGSLVFDDLTTPRPAHVEADAVSFEVADFSNAKGAAGKVSFSMRPKGGTLVAGAGTASMDPLAADLRLDLKRVPLQPFAPYLAGKVDAVLAGGFADGAFDYSWRAVDNGAARQTIKGKLTLAEMALLDRKTADELFRCGSFFIDGLETGVNPAFFKAKAMALSDFHVRIDVDPDATINLKRVFAGAAGPETPETEEAAAAAPPAPAAGPETPIAFDAMTLQGGTIDFADHYIKPNYSARLTEVGGRLSGLSSAEGKPADVDLRAKLAGFAPLVIRGAMQPFGRNMAVNLAAQFTDMELSPLTPYAGKYLGYTIEKGRLSFDVNYKIADRKLQASNKILFDQLTLGEKVASPQATSLPVRLAIALLKDRQGRIELNLPVTGSLDDPKFKVWRVVLQILRNLLVKAASSPFSLLGSLFGGGEELSRAEFAFGQDVPDAAAAAKIDALAKTLLERPALRLEIQGRYDAERDREGLRKRFLDRKVKAQKLKDLVRKGGAAVPVDDVVVPPEEYAKYLERAYKQETFPKPRTALGFAKSLPPEEMEKLILANIVPTDDDLRQLAVARAQNVKDRLLGPGKLPAERVLLVEPKAAPADPKLTGARADFALR
ncbi:MAG: DUF748 domain-containing protein [Candidatus Polarisedimenticolia bacterium]